MEALNKLITAILELIEVAKTFPETATDKANLLARAKEISNMVLTGAISGAKALTDDQKDAIGLDFSEKLIKVLQNGNI